MTAGVVLAAGLSSRMGRVKALLPIEGTTFLERLISIYTSCCDPVIVVLGHGADEIRPVTRGAQVVVNHDFKLGMFSSLQTGLRAVPQGASALFQPVDYALVLHETVALLAVTKASLVIPCFEGERGHPVKIGPSIIAELLELPPESQARDVIRGHYHEAEFLDVKDPGVVRDIDTPEDYQRWIG